MNADVYEFRQEDKDKAVSGKAGGKFHAAKSNVLPLPPEPPTPPPAGSKRTPKFARNQRIHAVSVRTVYEFADHFEYFIVAANGWWRQVTEDALLRYAVEAVAA